MSFISHRASGARELTMEEVLRIAPSVGAQEAHESRSARYAYIPTKTIMEGMMAEGFYPVMAQQGRTRIEGKAEFTEHLVRFRHRTEQFAVGAPIREIVLVNSHDGTSSYHLQAGLFRVVCLNGLITGDTYKAVKVPHKGNVRDLVIEGAYEVLGETKRAIEAVDHWQGIMLGAEEQKILTETAHMLRFPAEPDETEAERLARAPITPAQLGRARRTADVKDDLWTSFNITQENVIRGGLRGSTRGSNGRMRRVRTREVTGIDQSTALNRALWTLTERMAALKAA